MRRENILARHLRALSGKTQKEIAEEIGVEPPLIAQIELGQVVPGREHLHRMAASAGITLAQGEEILRHYETLHRGRRRRGLSAEDFLDEMALGLRSRAGAAYRRLLTLPLPDSPPKAEDRRRAEELFARLKVYPADVRLAVVEVDEDFQTWAFSERCCEASARETSR
jgi:transcriptional regulator with XRE-family HTH domain